MGSVFGSIFGKKRYRILMLGLDNAGKTSILTRLRLNDMHATVPTIGFTVDSIVLDRVHFTVWDVGGQDKIRPLWRHYFTGSQGLIYVIDSCDYERIDEARHELDKVLNAREMRDISLLVLCNKQDVPNSMQPEEVEDALHLENIKRPYAVVACSAKNGNGLVEGLRWLAKHCK